MVALSSNGSGNLVYQGIKIMNKIVARIVASSVIIISGVVGWIVVLQTMVGVGVDVVYAADSGCYKEHPLLVTVTNRFPIPLRYYRFTISATKPGHSRLARYGSGYESDKILNGWSSTSSCWSAPIKEYGTSNEKPQENPDLIWEGDLSWADWGVMTSGYLL